MLLAVFAFGVVFYWLAAQFDRAREQHAAVEKIVAQGGSVQYDYEYSEVPNAKSTGPSWLSSVFGIDFMHDVVVINFDDSTTDEDLAVLRNLPAVVYLHATGTQITDDGLKEIGALPNLERMLWLKDTNITDEGLVHLRGLTKLRCLDIEQTKVTRAGGLRLKKALPGLIVIWAGPGFALE